MKTNQPKKQAPLGAFYRRLALEGALKAVFLGLIFGFLLSAVVSAVSFATKFNALWVSLTVWAVAATGLSVLFYFLFFRPSIRRTAARVDGTGLEERAVTMMEFEGEDGLIYRIQREDARQALSMVSSKKLKIVIPKLLIALLIVTGMLSIFMMSYSTVLAVRAEQSTQQPVLSEESDEDKIIREMIEELRGIIDEAAISEELRSELHGIVDRLEASLKREDSLAVKVAKINEAAEEIHKKIEEYLSRSTIAEELQKYDTTRELGEAIGSEVYENVAAAFEKMYDSIGILAGAQKYDIIYQTAKDIERALEDAVNTPPKMEKALEDLKDAFLKALPPEPPDIPDPDADQATDEQIRDAIEAAKDAMQDAMEDFKGEQDAMRDTDDSLQEAIKDAMDRLGQQFEDAPKDEEPEQDPEEGEKPEEGEGSDTPPAGDGSESYDKVIDGETSYKDVYDAYYEEAKDEMESGDLDEDTRDVVQDFFDLLK